MNDNLQGWTTNTAKHPSSPVMQRTLWCLAQAVCAQDTWEHHKARVDKARAWLWHLTAFGKPSPTNSHPPCELSKLYTKSTTLKDNPEREEGGVFCSILPVEQNMFCPLKTVKKMEEKRERKKNRKRGWARGEDTTTSLNTIPLTSTVLHKYNIVPLLKQDVLCLPIPWHK